MHVLKLLVALALTFLPAWIWLQRLVPVGIPCRRLLTSGYALLLGLMGITLMMRLLSLFGVSFSLFSIGVMATLVFVAGLFVPPSWRSAAVAPPSGMSAAMPLTALQRFIFLLCLALLCSRLLALGIEVGTRPQFSWDGKQHWTKQAKVFFELRSVTAYVPLQEWLAIGGEGVYTNMHPDYAISTPLLQTWTNVALGEWHDSLMNLPWLLFWIALGLIFYAQARIAGVGRVTAMAGTYIMLSLPYVNTHVALAGYADLLLALCYLAAVCAFYNWSQGRQSWQAVLLLLCVSSGLLVKNEGFFWLMSLVPGLLLVYCGLRLGLWVGAALAAVLLGVLAFMPAHWVVAGHSLQQLALDYRPEGWPAIYQSFLLHDNWHFLSYLLLAALLLFLVQHRRLVPSLAPLASVLISAFALYFCLYLYTRYSFGAVRFTSLNRVALQLMPAAAFFALLVYANLAGQASNARVAKHDTSRERR
ncbi:MAG: hypothetical protein HRT77_14965 [Halioglobus sp.]|nr:hypothetical protein [Halioglobus sp.]